MHIREGQNRAPLFLEPLRVVARYEHLVLYRPGGRRRLRPRAPLTGSRRLLDQDQGDDGEEDGDLLPERQPFPVEDR